MSYRNEITEAITYYNQNFVAISMDMVFYKLKSEEVLVFAIRKIAYISPLSSIFQFNVKGIFFFLNAKEVPKYGWHMKFELTNGFHLTLFLLIDEFNGVLYSCALPEIIDLSLFLIYFFPS